MATAYIVAANRTAGGRKNGALAEWHPGDLGAQVLNAIVAETGVDPKAIEDVIMGCVSQAGEQAGQIGRTAVLASNLPNSVPAVTIDRQCGSSQQSIQFAAQAIMSGTQDLVIAAGVESMTRCPMGINARAGKVFDIPTDPTPKSVKEKFGIKHFSQFAGAEMIAKKHGHTKEQLDAFSVESHRRAAAATKSGAFAKEIVIIKGRNGEGQEVMHDKDEGIRYDASMEGMASLKILMEDGVMTAANASQICDGASAVMIASEAAIKAHNLTPLARIHNVTVTAGDPVIMLEEPLFATDRALQRAGMKIGDIDLYEVNEAFAPVPLAWLKHVGADPSKLNVNGGAISLGHPLGASGTKLMATLVHALRARGGKYGLQTMCEGGGVANVTIIEAL
ncbi:acetyl-CoA acyltransferase/thiolase family protein [Hyphomonas neptunium ATCC 15444]|uniref:Acetyl-CoA acyltransferase/thiolase family protein n=2 Tax=Hyphomonas TaxID=85 RepID=Q0BXI4_HYPNA|nr:MULTISPECIES: acetyl-CoA C-acetyltransferase [Hyphomonas]ABI76951.1 acetyl-CoA acyltransferase/thiolase family protein [Hyphomonas neptunium ATCC 15444]KCZ89918.1 acetyl-CoA acyltransferase/thiolase family protein [Hyphomonas hirschiana VP5]